MDTERRHSHTQIQNLTQERDRAKKEHHDSDRLYKQEVEKHFKRNLELESENAQLTDQVNDLRITNSRNETIISERESTIVKYSDKINEWQNKAAYTEDEIIQIAGELSKVKAHLADRDREVENLKYENRKSDDEIKFLKEMQNKLQSRIREAENSLDEERKMLKEANEDLAREYKNYSDEAEKHQKEMRNNYEKMIHEYTSRLDEQTHYIE